MVDLFRRCCWKLHMFIAFFSLSIAATNATFAQQVGYKLYTIDDGLVQSEVTAIHQDRKGFLWVGTKCGISRFDGHTFQTIHDTAGISESWVHQIFSLNDTTLWFHTARGSLLITQHPQSMEVKSFPSNLQFIGFWVAKGKGHMVSQEGNYFQLDHQGLKQVENRFSKLFRQLIGSNPFGTVIYTPKEDLYYLRGTHGELICLRDTTPVELPVESFDNLITGLDGNTYLITPNNSLTAYLSTKGVKYWKGYPTPPHEEMKLSLLSDTTLLPVAHFGDNYSLPINVWLVKSRDTIYCTSYDYSNLYTFTRGQWNTYRLPFPHISMLLIDREGNLWGSSPLGLIMVHPPSMIEFNEHDGLYNNLQIVAEDKHHCIITGSFEKGFQKIDNNKVTNLAMPHFPGEKVSCQVYPGSGKNRDGILYLAVNPYGMITWDGTQFKPSTGFPITAAYSFFDDTLTNQQYIGADIGLVTWEWGKQNYHVQALFPGGKKNKIVAIAQDDTGNLLLGGFHGLTLLKEGRITHLPTKELSYTQGANAMARDHRGNIWIGNSNGLWMFDNNTFRKIDNPWFNNLVVSLCPVGHTTLFIGGLYGIGLLDLEAFYNRDTVIIRFFNADNGFHGRECQQNAVCTDHNGTLWVATTNSLQRIDPTHLPPPEPGPMTYIERVSLIDETMKSEPVINSTITEGLLQLNNHQDNLRFDFTAPVFRGASFVQFRYMLEGHDKQWSPPTKERYAVYTNLDPGRYTFRVIACNDAGIWSPKPATFTVIITPALWQQGWFKATTALVAAAFFFLLGIAAMKQRKNRAQQRLEYEKQIAELQLVSIRNQIDPHFTFNAINSIASVILKEEKEKAYNFFVKLSAMIRQVLASGDQVTRPLAEELEFVQNYLEIEKMRFPETFQFTINLPDNVTLTREVPKMVIQTYAENAIKHGLLNKKEGEGRLVITLTQTKENLTIVVEDNGIGRVNARKLGQKSTGKGMAILNFYYDFFDRYNTHKILHTVTDLYDEQHQPLGTRVTVVIPEGFSYRTS